MSIRKFVGYAGAAAVAIGVALMLAVQAQAGPAVAPDGIDHSTAAQHNPSAACTAAIQAIRDAVVADRSEDGSERAVAKTNPDATADRTEDGAEIANFTSLFSAARTACAPAATAAGGGGTEEPRTTFTPSAQCTAAIQALKAAWAQGRPTTMAQWMQLQTLARAVRTACGFTWTGDR